MPAVPAHLPPPAPEEATTWAEFTSLLRALHEWCGSPKYRALCMRCPGLSPAAVSTLIGKNPLSTPPEVATARFVDACLRYRDWPDPEAETARWTARWTLIDAGWTAPDGPVRDGRAPWYVAAGLAAGVVTVLVMCRVIRGRGR